MKFTTWQRFIPFVLVLGLGVLVVLLLGKNKISQLNSLRRTANYHLELNQYPEAVQTLNQLQDSIQLHQPPLVLNLGHVGYFQSLRSNPDTLFQDSTYRQWTTFNWLQFSKSSYDSLHESDPATYLSAAKNQSGLVLLRINEFEKLRGDSLKRVLTDCAEYFRQAVKADPKNEAARFNYELTLRLIRYPEAMDKELDYLIANRQYQQAYDTLNKAMKRYKLLDSKAETLQKLKIIATIDTLKTK